MAGCNEFHEHRCDSLSRQVTRLTQDLAVANAKIEEALNFKHADCGSCLKNGVVGVTHVETTVDDLRAILSRDTPEGESDEYHDSLIRMHDRCPTCGFPLEEGAKVCVTPN